MEIGIFARTFNRPTLDETLDAVREHGLRSVQFNLASAGMSSLPEQIEPKLCDTIRRAMADRGLTIAAVSGTFNMIHPDPQQRRAGLRKLAVLVSACHRLGSSVISLCTGTRDPNNMWRRHPDNDSPEAWHDLRVSMAEALRAAEAHNVTLAFEPEVANVIDTAQKGRRLLDEMQSPCLKVVIDGANLFHTGELPRMHDILNEAFDLLGQDVVMAHAKDLDRDGAAGNIAAGLGLLDYDHYLSKLRQVGFDGPLLLHGLVESQVSQCVTFLRRKLAANPPQTT